MSIFSVQNGLDNRYPKEFFIGIGKNLFSGFKIRRFFCGFLEILNMHDLG